MKLKCLGDYRSSFGSYVKGQDVEVDDDTAALLQRDSPGSFEPAEAEKPKHERKPRGPRKTKPTPNAEPVTPPSNAGPPGE